MTEPNKSSLGRRVILTVEQVENLAYSAAGAASVPFMQDHPDYVMPVARIKEGIEPLLDEFLRANGVPR